VNASSLLDDTDPVRYFPIQKFALKLPGRFYVNGFGREYFRQFDTGFCLILQRLPLKNFLKKSIGLVLNEQQQTLKLDSV
jgi:hypothetical protein